MAAPDAIDRWYAEQQPAPAPPEPPAPPPAPAAALDWLRRAAHWPERRLPRSLQLFPEPPRLPVRPPPSLPASVSPAKGALDAWWTDKRLKEGAQRFAQFARRHNIFDVLSLPRQVREDLDFALRTDPGRFGVLVQQAAPEMPRAKVDQWLFDLGVGVGPTYPAEWPFARALGMRPQPLPPLGHTLRHAAEGVEGMVESIAGLPSLVFGTPEERRRRTLYSLAAGVARGKPPKGETLAEQAVYGAARMAPPIAATFVLPAGRLGKGAGLLAKAKATLPATAFWVSQIAPERYVQYRVEGLSDPEARAAALSSGLVEAAVETLMGALGSGRFGQAVRGPAGQRALRQTVWRVTKEYVKELAEEPTQELVSECFKRGVVAASDWMQRHEGRPLSLAECRRVEQAMDDWLRQRERAAARRRLELAE